ncbi:TRAP-type C4-dicarboxylate transport system, small permease component [Sulfitobacter brevis]|uniref:TRAP transporter small permease protein n=1 Tax=Sulfitobacter brevis TaxID=74348 RepID=A0A1I2BW90_9RHOB|nr:TRAP transporter small permease subunit [Sulfitobacter brevis]SFE60274.1 TRAP-type C4-dicarboxylate transport system, small permease component [Sulfitobacter brevis]
MSVLVSAYQSVLRGLEQMSLVIAGIVLLGMGGIMTASVLGKELFLRPVPDDLLMVGLLNVAVIVLPLAYVERTRGHIAVSVTTDWLPPRALGALRAFGAFAMAIFFGGIGFMVSLRMPGEIAKGAYYDGALQIPTWPMKAIFGFGILLLVLRLLSSIAAGVTTAITGRDEDPSLSEGAH